MKYDFTIIGGGIVGLATGLALSRACPGASLLILEKEENWASHQSGRNSGVIHSGIYYKPGSLKATMTRVGSRALLEFCRAQGIAFEICGKVIVATQSWELPLLENLYERGLDNGLRVKKISVAELKDIEPHIFGLAAIKVLETGIVDYRRVAETFAALIETAGGDLRLNTEVKKLDIRADGVNIESQRGSFKTRYLINCAGLHSDRIAGLVQAKTGAKIIPFRGEYYELRPDKRYLVKHLVYPVPNPSFPFLGVHFTRMIDGAIHAGPNAVLSFKREGYKKTDFGWKDFAEIITYPGFWKLLSKHLKAGTEEIIRSFSKRAFTKSLQQLLPEVTAADLVPAPAGVRAQALLKDGRLVDDFLLVEERNTLHVCNAPSPAATASIDIGAFIARRVLSASGIPSKPQRRPQAQS
ncbi:MAG: L-2-hydroxyglutarate oxidase [Actinomycetota bacterium]|nr:L-2-hydroxyglutarate oxidase [Actinomycetota bacterium]